jgi:hypothetical protein
MLGKVKVMLSLYITNLHAMKMWGRGDWRYSSSSLALAPAGGEWPASCPVIIIDE